MEITSFFRFFWSNNIRNNNQSIEFASKTFILHKKWSIIWWKITKISRKFPYFPTQNSRNFGRDKIAKFPAFSRSGILEPKLYYALVSFLQQIIVLLYNLFIIPTWFVVFCFQTNSMNWHDFSKYYAQTNNTKKKTELKRQCVYSWTHLNNDLAFATKISRLRVFDLGQLTIFMCCAYVLSKVVYLRGLMVR